MIGGFLLVVVWLWYGCRFLVNDWVYVVGLWLLGLWWLWYGWLGLCGGFVSDEFVVIVVWVVGFWNVVGLWLSCDMEFFRGMMGL